MRWALILSLTLATPAVAGEPVLNLPLDCTLGSTCFIQQYTDADSGPGASDYSCGPLSYDGHKGTDIALQSLAAFRAGVDVYPGAPGVVRSVRDGMADHLQGSDGAPDVTDKECGNGVVIDHGDGWETQYCHMKRGSIQVRRGNGVDAQTVLGQVGLSGQTEFPHLHLSVRHDGEIIDPFNPDATFTCGTPERTLWQDTPEYRPGGLIAAGFSDAVPEYAAIKDGTAGAESLPGGAPALVLWAYGYGGHAGDVLKITITGPSGNVLSQEATLDRPLAQYFRAVGRRTPGEGWSAGDYTGTIRLLRDGTEIEQRATVLTITP